MAGDDRHEGPITNFTLSRLETNKIARSVDEADRPRPRAARERRADDGSARATRQRRRPHAQRRVDCADGADLRRSGSRTAARAPSRVHPRRSASGAPTVPPDCIAGIGRPAHHVTAAYDALWADPVATARTRRARPLGELPEHPARRPAPDHRPGHARSGRPSAPATTTRSSASQRSTSPAGTACRRVRRIRRDTAGGQRTLRQRRSGNEIWGHFIRFVEPSSVGAPKNTGSAGQRPVRPERHRHRRLHRDAGPVDTDPRKST